MNINTQYAWQSSNNDNSREISHLLPRNVRGIVIGKSGYGKSTVIFNLLVQPDWLDYNHQQKYKVLRKGFEAGLSKEQVSNVFANQEALHATNVSPLTAIDTFSGARSGKKKTDFYDDCQDIPDPSALDPMQKNLLLSDDCFQGKQNCCRTIASKGSRIKSRRTTLELDTTLIRYILHRTTSAYPDLPFPQGVKNLAHIHADHCAIDILAEYKHFFHGVWSDAHNFVTIDLTSTPVNGKYR